MPDENGMPNYPFDGERPPGAPDSPAFWAISAALLKMDTINEQPGDGAFLALLKHYDIDLEVVRYVANQRMQRGLQSQMPLSLEKLLIVAMSMWIDGYTAGVVERAR